MKSPFSYGFPIHYTSPTRSTASPGEMSPISTVDLAGSEDPAVAWFAHISVTYLLHVIHVIYIIIIYIYILYIYYIVLYMYYMILHLIYVYYEYNILYQIILYCIVIIILYYNVYVGSLKFDPYPYLLRHPCDIDTVWKIWQFAKHSWQKFVLVVDN